jgi:diguanylate cyclase (GGDEF)-like protein
MSIIMIDVDHFKSYNDCYGHPAGDQCLRAIVRTVKDFARRGGGIPARYRGNEIAMLLPGSDPSRAYAVAERIRSPVHGLAIQHAVCLRGIVTISSGVATCVPRRTPRGWLALIYAADAALYAAQVQGRDNVKVAESSVAKFEAKQAAKLALYSYEGAE